MRNMKFDKGLVAGSSTMLILALLESNVLADALRRLGDGG